MALIAAGIAGVAFAIVIAFSGVMTADAATYTFTKNLTVGSTGVDVMNLQKVLNSDAATQVASTGAGSPGNESSYFGGLTKAAVMKFQSKYGISPVAGYVGPITRAKLNTMTVGGTVSTTPGCTPGALFSSTTGAPCVTTTTPTTPATGTGISVAAGVQPAASLAPESASRVPFTRFTLTAGNDGDVSVNSVTVQREGLAHDAVFAGIVLLDENGQQIGIAKTLNSNHQTSIGDPFIVPRGTTRTFTVAGNMVSNLDSYAGEVPVLSVVGINTSAAVSGSLPIMGAGHTINATLSIGTVTNNISSFDPNTSASKEIGTTGYKFSGIRLTAGSAEQVRLRSIRWNQSGSAGPTDLGNVKVVVDGTMYDTTVSSDGKYYSATFGSGIVVDKGLSKDIYIQGDIVGAGAAGRTIKFDIYKNTDVYITGETYMYGVTPPVGSGTAADATSEFTATTPWFDGSKVTVSAGSITTITKANSVAAQNIAINVPNQVLGGFDIDLKGEAISVQSQVFHFNSSIAASGNLLTNVSLVDQNGAVVAGPVDATLVTGTEQKVTFTDTVTYPVGKRTYTLKGKLPTTFSNNATITASTTPGGSSADWSTITGQTTGNSISLSALSSAVTMNTMTVKGAALTISVASSPASQTIVSGGVARTMAGFQLDASQSGEDVRLSTFPVRATFSVAGNMANVSGCQLYDGATALNTGSNVLNGSSSDTSTKDYSITLDSSLVVAKGTIKTLTLKCNVSAAASGYVAFGLVNGASVSVTGVTSSNDVSENIVTATGPLMTSTSAGSITVTKDSSSPAYSAVAAGTTGVVVGQLRFTSTNEAVNLSRIALQMTGGSSSSTPADLQQVTIWDGATQVGTATFTGTSRNATSTLSSTVTIPKDSYKILTVKADLSAHAGNPNIGTSGNPLAGALIAIDYDGNDSTGTQGTGADSGTTINSASSDTAVAGVRVFRSYPIITYSTTGGVATNGQNELLSINIAANSSGDVTMYRMVFSVSTTTVTNLTSANFTFTGPTGNVTASNPSLSADGLTLTVTFDSTTNTSDAVISAGQSKTYSLKYSSLNLTGSNTTGSVTVGLKADTSYPGLPGSILMGSTTGITNVNMGNIIWSPNSTTTQSINTVGSNDWTNGYGLPGCFTTSGLGQNCLSRTVAK
jgi:hypothetical protein